MSTQAQPLTLDRGLLLVLWALSLHVPNPVLAQPEESPVERVAVEVRGALDLAVSRSQQGPARQLTGKVSDELGRPVRARLQLLDDDTPARIENCLLDEAPEQRDADPVSATENEVLTSSQGTFCLRPAEGWSDSFVLRAQAEHFEPAERPLDELQRVVPPRITAAPDTVELSAQTSATVSVLAPVETGRQRRRPITLLAQCEQRSVALGKRRVATAERARFEFSPSELPGPGLCNFVAVDESSAARSEPKPVVVRGQANLTVAAIEQREQRVILQLAVQAAQGSAALGSAAQGPAEPGPSAQEQSTQPSAALVDDGLIEVRENGAFIASSPVQGGASTLELERTSEMQSVVMTYVPGSRLWMPGEGVTINVPATEPSPWRRVGHALILLAFFGWLGFIWLGRRQPQAARPLSAATGVAHLDQERGARGPVRGLVVDAHTSLPVRHAQVELLSVRATEQVILETARSDSAGAFSFRTRLEDHSLLRLRISSPSTVTWQHDISSSRLTTHVVHRRRAVLEPLLNWARRRSLGRATPEQVSRWARQRQDQAATLWAGQVSEAAYGPEMPSEADVAALAAPVAPSYRPKEE